MESWNQLIQVGTFSMDEGALLSLITGGRINDYIQMFRDGEEQLHEVTPSLTAY